jgi:hypothetical protein
MQHRILIGINTQVGKTMLIFRPALKNECRSEENYNQQWRTLVTVNQIRCACANTATKVIRVYTYMYLHFMCFFVCLVLFFYYFVLYISISVS